MVQNRESAEFNFSLPLDKIKLQLRSVLEILQIWFQIIEIKVNFLVPSAYLHYTIVCEVWNRIMSLKRTKCMPQLNDLFLEKC